jgi:iron complex outermembrane receptor protein
VLDLAHARREFGAAEFYAPFPSFEKTRTTSATGRWAGRVSNSLTLEPRISWRRHEDDFVLRRGDPDFYRNEHESRRLTGEVQARVPLGAGGLAFGGEWSREELESSNLGDRRQDWRAGYGEVSIRSGSAQLQGGVRWDDRTDVGSFVSPSASVRFESGSGTGLRASWGRTFRAPTWTERYYVDPANVGTPDLEAEQGWSAEVALELRRELGTVTVTGFRRFTEDLIDWARPVGSGDAVPWETRNVEESTVEGVEVSMMREVGPGVRLDASASWLTQEARVEDGFLSKYALRPLHRVFTVRAFFPLPDESSVGVAASDRARLGGGGGVRVDVRFDFPVGQARGFLDVRNATDESFPDVTGFSIPGRAFVAGIRTTFGG